MAAATGGDEPGHIAPITKFQAKPSPLKNDPDQVFLTPPPAIPPKTCGILPRDAMPHVFKELSHLTFTIACGYATPE
jgi:hypothetical protein